jgi:sugar lactone lactonase YvrE
MKSTRERFAALALAALCAAPQLAGAEGQPVGTIVDFISNLDAVAGGKCRQPEGLAVDPLGNLYLASNSDQATTVEYVCVFDRTGAFKDAIPVPAGPNVKSTSAFPQVVGLLGEMWDHDWLYVLDQADNVAGHGRILKINLQSRAVVTIPYCGDPRYAPAFPNTIIQDRQGQRYVSDSLQGVIYRFGPDDDCARVWAGPDTVFLSTNPNQNVGLNDMAIDREERHIYVDVTGNRQLYRVPLNRDGSAGAPELFADGALIDAQLGLPSPTALFGPDGVQFDVLGDLYVCANQAEEIQVYSPAGKLIHRYSGIGANAMDFPASIAFRGHRLFITNMQADYVLPHSKLSVLQAPFAGLPLPLGDDE